MYALVFLGIYGLLGLYASIAFTHYSDVCRGHYLTENDFLINSDYIYSHYDISLGTNVNKTGKGIITLLGILHVLLLIVFIRKERSKKNEIAINGKEYQGYDQLDLN